MSCYIKTGYVHLINSATDELTFSEVAFDTVMNGVGAYFENVVGKILDNHNRRPGKFKSNSYIKKSFEEFALKKMDLEELSQQIAQEIYDAKVSEEIKEASTIFVMESSESIYCLEVKRESRYFVKCESSDGKGANKVYAEALAIPNIRADKVSFFEVNLQDLSVSTLEPLHDGKIYLLSDVVLRADMDHSLNYYVRDARQALYTTVIDKASGLAQISDFKRKKDVDLLNRFEEKMKNHLFRGKEIDFIEIGHELFFNDVSKRNKFIDQLKNSGITKPIKSLSRKSIALKMAEYVPQKVVLENGVQILVPDDVEEVDVKLKEIDGEFKAVV